MIENSSKVLPEMRRLFASDTAEYRELRLDGLWGHPEAFGASWEEEAAKPPTWFEDRLSRNFIFGGGIAATSAIRGIAGFYAPNAAKQRHKGVLWACSFSRKPEEPA